MSVVIATYNRAPLLRGALDQLRRQVFEEADEVIVVDNASTDATRDVVAEASARFPVPLRYLREEAPGKTPALNAGLAIARGDILALTDDDVLVADRWLARIRQLFGGTTVDLVGGRVDPAWERRPPWWLRIEADAEGRYGALASPLALLHYGAPQELGHRTAVGANLALRRRVLEALGGIAPHLGRHRGTLLCGEDHDLCQRAVSAGYRCEYRPEVRVSHWVPKARASLRYYLRWFFWSGITQAILDASAVTDGQSGRAGMRRYFIAQLAIAPLAGLKAAFSGRPADAVARVMDAAFALGYLSAHTRPRRSSGTSRGLTTATESGRQAGVHG